MSLTNFLEMRDVQEKVKNLRPKLPRKIGVPLRVEPRSNRYTMVGTAFDYLLRFELQRRAPHAVPREWVAEHVPDTLWTKTGMGEVGLDLLRNTPNANHYLPPEEVSKRARAIVENGKAAVDAHVRNKAPKHTQFTELSAHAIRLAKLDEVFRARQLDPRFEEADIEDVEDLCAMLDIVPFDLLLHSKPLLLNPDFKESSLAVGGADTDLIAGDLLVDLKVTRRGEMMARDLDQLLGYYLLARNQRRLDCGFPEIKRVALYFCRHGYLWVMDTPVWTEHREFPEIEKWFFTRATEVFGGTP